MINELKETHNQNVDQQHGFHHLLDEMGIPYVEEDFFLHVGEPPVNDGWALFLSVNTEQIPQLLKMVGPLLYGAGIAFSVVKEKEDAEQRNGFWYGPNEVGKLITVFTGEEMITSKMIDQLDRLTADFRGPYVNDAIRLGEIIHVTYAKYIDKEEEKGEIVRKRVWTVPDIKKIPFRIDRKYQFWKTKRLLKRRYVPLVMISRSPKGDLLKSVDLKGFRFNWCFIKEGKKYVFTDKYGRSIKDRLLWQAKILSELSGQVPMPKYIDYFEQGEESYLVMELLEGVDLHDKIDEIYQKRSWDELPGQAQLQLVEYYLAVLEIIGKMHQLGYVHRDATARNFMVLHSGDVYTIDLELAYSLHRNEPYPPFAMGVFGYVSPEQIVLRTPTVNQDIYTMGALLLHILTGKHPAAYVDRNSDVDLNEMEKDLKVVVLREIILKCLDKVPENRPAMEELRAAVENAFR